MHVPITGVAGVLGGGDDQVSRQIHHLVASPESRPDAVEVRADLFDDPTRAVQALGELPPGLPTIFTVRLPGHGGRYEGDEPRRTALYLEALRGGATLVDAEGESPAARDLAREGAPLIASHHDFQGLPRPRELEQITGALEALQPCAIKLVPTAATTRESLAMLRWVASAPKDTAGGPPRVGFAMGQAGIASRVLSLAWGAPWTYAALGEAVAPGLLTVSDLKDGFLIGSIRRETPVFGLLSPDADTPEGLSPVQICTILNRAFAARKARALFVPWQEASLRDALEPQEQDLPLGGFIVPQRLQEEALALGRELGATTPAARTAGGADVLVVHPGSRGERGERKLTADHSSGAADGRDADERTGPWETLRLRLRALTGVELSADDLESLRTDPGAQQGGKDA